MRCPRANTSRSIYTHIYVRERATNGPRTITCLDVRYNIIISRVLGTPVENLHASVLFHLPFEIGRRDPYTVVRPVVQVNRPFSTFVDGSNAADRRAHVPVDGRTAP